MDKKFDSETILRSQAMNRISTVEDRIDRLERKVNVILWLTIVGIIIKLFIR